MNYQQSQSGMAWPPALRRRLGIPPSANSNSVLSDAAATMSRQQHHHDHDDNDDDSSSDSDNDMMLPPPSSNINAIRMNNLNTESNPSNKASSSSSLRSYIHQSYAKLTSIQRQLHRGEESYYEDTYSRGNLFQGWDNIWIEQQHSNSSADSAGACAGGSGMLFDSLESSGSETIGTAGGGGTNNATTTNNSNNNINKHSKSIPIRKMPQDYRWFSSSCTSIVPTMEGDKKGLLERTSLVKRPNTPEVKEEIVIVGSSISSSGEKMVKKDVEEEDDISKTTTNDDVATNESTKANTQPDVTISSFCESGGQENDEKPSNIEPAMTVESQSTSKVESALENQKQELPASSNNQSTNTIGTIQPDEAPSTSSKLSESSKADKVLPTINQSDHEQSKITESTNIMESETANEAPSSRDVEQTKDSAPMQIEPMVVKGAVKDSDAAVPRNNVSTSATAATRPNQSGEAELPGAADTAVPTSVEGEEAAAVNQSPPPYSSLPVAKRSRLTKEEGGDNSKKGSVAATRDNNTTITTEPSPLSDAAVFGDSPAIPPSPAVDTNVNEKEVEASTVNKNGGSPVADDASATKDGADDVQDGEDSDDDEADTTSDNRRSSRRKRKASS